MKGSKRSRKLDAELLLLNVESKAFGFSPHPCLQLFIQIKAVCMER